MTQTEQTLHNLIMKYAVEWATKTTSKWDDEWYNGVVTGLVFAFIWLCKESSAAASEYNAMLRHINL